MRRNWIIILLLVVVTAAVFARIAGCQFVIYDDPDYVFANPHVKAGLTTEGVAWAFATMHGRQTYWHPITWLSHMLDCELFGLRAGLHHLVNLLFHLVNVALLFHVCRRMTGAVWRSAAVAALFALHPLQVDTVAWVTERKNVLSALFWLLAMLSYVRYAESPRWSRYWPALVWLTLGLMAKPVLVTLPFALLLLDFWPLRRFAWAQVRDESTPVENPPRPVFPAVSLPRLVLEKLPMIPLILASVWLTVAGHKGFGVDQAVHGIPLFYRIENALVSYARYLGKTFWPADLAVLYPHPGEWPGAFVVGSALLFFAITVLVVWRGRREPWLPVGWFWFVGVLVPAIGLMQFGVQAMADRFIYVPLIGLLIMVVWAVSERAAEWPRRAAVLGTAAGGALAALIVVTSLQLRYWRDSISLFEHTLAVTRNNFLIHNNLAFALNAEGRQEEALQHVITALRIKPDFIPAHLQMALLLHARQATAEALEHYQIVARLKPNEPFILKNLGAALASLGRPDEAIEQFSTLLRLTPGDPEAHAQLAALLSLRHRTDEALDHYRVAVRSQPDAPAVLNNLAWILATNPKAEFRNGAEAVKHAERACELTRRREPIFLGTLAAAYAEAGRFDDAVTAAQQAIDLATAAGAKDLAATNKRLQELYRTRKSYREETPKG